MTRFYGTAEWRRLRAACLARFPVCVTEGCKNGAVVADHVIPRSMGGSDSLSNLVGRCITCHNRRRGTDEPKLPGCNADGTPRDWSHWWKNDGKSLRAGGATVRGGRKSG